MGLQIVSNLIHKRPTPCHCRVSRIDSQSHTPLLLCPSCIYDRNRLSNSDYGLNLGYKINDDDSSSWNPNKYVESMSCAT